MITGCKYDWTYNSGSYGSWSSSAGSESKSGRISKATGFISELRIKLVGVAVLSSYVTKKIPKTPTNFWLENRPSQMWHPLYIVIHTQWWAIKQKWIWWWNLWFNKIRILHIFSIWILIENIIQLLLMFFLQNFIFLKKFYDSTKNGFHSDLTSIESSARVKCTQNGPSFWKPSWEQFHPFFVSSKCYSDNWFRDVRLQVHDVLIAKQQCDHDSILILRFWHGMGVFGQVLDLVLNLDFEQWQQSKKCES